MSDAVRCGSKEWLVAYLYDECDPDDRARAERHLTTCAECQHELASLRSTRRALESWAVPDRAVGLRLVSDQPVRPVASRPARAAWRPAWALAAAALLAVVIGGVLGGIDVQYDQAGVLLRVGWPTADAARGPAAVTSAQARVDEASWRRELGQLESRLRQEVEALREASAAQRPTSAPGVSERELLRQVRQWIDESEQRQQRQLAQRLMQVSQEFDVQRQLDWARIQQGFGQLQYLSGVPPR